MNPAIFYKVCKLLLVRITAVVLIDVELVEPYPKIVLNPLSYKTLLVLNDCAYYRNSHNYDAFCTVQPDGIPEVPVVQDDIEAFLTNVPEAATLYTQLLVHISADISVAKHLI